MANFDQQRQKAFDFCADVTKQLITISAGIIAFTITFSKDFVGDISDIAKIFAYLSWGLHFISILFGILVLLSLTAQLEPKESLIISKEPPNVVPAPTIRNPTAKYSLLQIAAFLLAISLTIIFGIQAAWTSAEPSKKIFDLKIHSS